MVLKEELQKLVQLQEIDVKIYQFKQDKDVNKPKILQELKTDLESKKENQKALEEKLQQLQLAKKDRELDLQAKEESVKKAQSDLYQLKSNKEYQAKLNEISSIKADVSIMDEEVLKVIEQIESREKELQEEKAKVQEEEKKFLEQESTIKKEIADLDAQIKGLDDKRQGTAREVDPKIASKYEHMLKAKGGVAIVPVNSEHCGACNIKLTPQKINEIKMFEHLVTCESCQRLLYIPEDLQL